MKEPILAIDIGSTRTHLASVDAQKLKCADRIDFDNTLFNDMFISSIRKITSKNRRIRRVNIASCVKELSVRAADFCKTEGCFTDILTVKARDDLPVSFNYDVPKNLGADRICNALACAALFRGQTCMIIDSGTAVTVDYLYAGKKFLGGAILPGCAMQLEALSRGAEALPLVSIDSGVAASALGASTVDCVKSGVLFGTAGAIERFATEYTNAGGDDKQDDLKIAATGGGWKVIESLVSVAGKTIAFIPDLTLIGVGQVDVEL